MNSTRKLIQVTLQFAALALVVGILIFAISTLANGRPNPAVAPGQTETPTPAPTPLPQSAVGEPVTVTFAVPDWHQSLYQELAAAFHQQNPGITIQIIPADTLIGSDYPNSAQKLAAGADSGFYFLNSVDRLPGLFLDLAPWVQAAPDFQVDEFFPSVLETVQRDGQLLALPSHIVTLNFVLVDRDLLAQAGLALPQPDWNRDEFLALAQALTRRSGDQVAQYGFVDYTGAGMEIMLYERARQALTQGRLDAPEMVEALRWYAGLDTLHKVMPPLTSGVDPFERDRKLVEGGQAAMWTDSLYNYHAYTKSGRNLALLPLPSDGGAAVPANLGAYFISAQARQPQAAWQWLNFLTRQAVPRNYADYEVPDLPARRSLADQMQYWDAFDPQSRPTLQAAAERLSFSTTSFSTQRPYIETAVAEVRLNALAVEEALANAQTAYQQERAALASAATPTPIPAPAQSEGPAVTITFAVAEHLHQALRELATGFHLQYPDITVEIISANALEGTDFANALPRLAAGADSGFYQLQLNTIPPGLLLDLTPWMERETYFQPEDFFPGTLQAFQQDGQQLALPSQAYLSFALLDRDLLDQAGLALPGPDWSRDEFLALAQALTQRSDDQVTRYGFVDYSGAGIQILVYERARQALIDGRLDAPEMADALRWYSELDTVQHVMPAWSADSDAFEQNRKLVEGGRAAMWTDSLDNYIYLTQQGRRLALLPLPAEGGAAVPAAMDGYFISAQTQHPQAAWQWINFLTHQAPVQRTAGSVSGQMLDLPARRSVADRLLYWDGFDTQAQAALHQGAEHLSFTMPELLSLYARVYQAMEAVRGEGRPVEAALAEAQAAYQQALISQRSSADPFVYTVVPGDTCASIAVAFQVSVQSIISANGLPEDCSTLRVDQALSILPPTPSAAQSTSAAPVASTRITFYGAGIDPNELGDLFRAFQQEHPAYHVEPFTAAASPDQADCFAGMELSPQALNLQALAQADPGFSSGDYRAGLLAPFTQQGELYGLPYMALPRVIRYNPALFDAAGVPYPRPDWTLDDFLQAARALTKDTPQGKQYGYVPQLGEASDLPVFAAIQGAPLWDENGQPRFTQPDVVAAIHWYADLANRYQVMPLFADSQTGAQDMQGIDARLALIQGGRAAMWSEYYFGRYTFFQTPTPPAGVAPLPAGVNRATDFIYHGLMISRRSQHPQACWEWIKFLSRQPLVADGLPAYQGSVQPALTLPPYAQAPDPLRLAEVENLEQLLLHETLDAYAWQHARLFTARDSLQTLSACLFSGMSVEEALAKAQQEYLAAP